MKYTIANNIEHQLVINKSQFIVNLIQVENEDQIIQELNNIKHKYKKATHHCYGYIINNIKRFNDDNEPSGTAGIPILSVLEKQQLNNVLCVITRYFGGIKLGAGGLIRAYTKGVTEALNKTKIIPLVEQKTIIIGFNYEYQKQIDNILKNITIVNKEFKDKVLYTIKVEINKIDNLKQQLKNIPNIEIEV